MATKSMSDDPVAGARAQGQRAARSNGRPVRRARKPRHQLSPRKLAELTPAQLESWDGEYGLPVLRGEIVTGKYV